MVNTTAMRVADILYLATVQKALLSYTELHDICQYRFVANSQRYERCNLELHATPNNASTTALLLIILVQKVLFAIANVKAEDKMSVNNQNAAC